MKSRLTLVRSFQLDLTASGFSTSDSGCWSVRIGGKGGARRWDIPFLALILFFPLVFDASALAGKPGNVSFPFAKYVPDSAKVFVSVPRLSVADSALRRAHAGRLVPFLAGHAATDETPFDLIKAVMGLLELDRSVDSDALLQSEIGVAARSWSEFDTAVWFLRPERSEVIEQWFPRDRRSVSGTAHEAHFFRMPSGVTVYLRDGTAAVSRYWGPESLLHETTQLMAGDGGSALDRVPGFRKLVAHLPVDCLAAVYLAHGGFSPTEPAAWPVGGLGIEDAVVALYEGDGRLNIAVQASVATPRATRKLGREAIARLLRLPQTTLFGSVSTFDFDKAYQAATTGPKSQSWARYLMLLAAMAAGPDETTDNWAGVGPHVILAWGQDLRESRSTLQVAAIIEARDEDMSRGFAQRIANALIDLIKVVEPSENEGTLEIQESRHLGVTIHHIPIRQYASGSKIAIMSFMANTEPSWVVWNGWLILALSRDHIERILEAQSGMIPVLASVPDLRALSGRHTSRSTIAIAQAGVAADVLDQWITSSKAGSGSLLDPTWWESVAPATPPQEPRLGIGMKVGQEPGVVVVARVYPSTAATGRLMVGDRILGIDGALLSLSSPNADLRSRWTASVTDSGSTVRLLREGKVVDVELPRRNQKTAAAWPRIEPVDVVRELASLGRTIPFMSLAVQPTDETHFSALLSLRLSPGNTPGSRGR